jgi:hypothetical protein
MPKPHRHGDAQTELTDLMQNIKQGRSKQNLLDPSPSFNHGPRGNTRPDTGTTAPISIRKLNDTEQAETQKLTRKFTKSLEMLSMAEKTLAEIKVIEGDLKEKENLPGWIWDDDFVRSRPCSAKINSMGSKSSQNELPAKQSILPPIVDSKEQRESYAKNKSLTFLNGVQTTDAYELAKRESASSIESKSSKASGSSAPRGSSIGNLPGSQKFEEYTKQSVVARLTDPQYFPTATKMKIESSKQRLSFIHGSFNGSLSSDMALGSKFSLGKSFGSISRIPDVFL